MIMKMFSRRLNNGLFHKNVGLKSGLTLKGLPLNGIQVFGVRFPHRRPDSSRPEFWYQDYPISLIGKRQSPININTQNCVHADQVSASTRLNIKYPPVFTDLTLRNPKTFYFGWQVDVGYDLADQTLLSGGPLKHRYRLAQFNCHWGKDCSCGSEHTVDGRQYSAELHFVHWNIDLFSSVRDAFHSKNGLAVVAVFLQTGPKPNEEMNKLLSLMSHIRFKGDKIRVKEPMNLMNLMPDERSYWSYLGSLTTPPLWESVTWIIFKQPIMCTEHQINEFRGVYYYPSGIFSCNDVSEDDINVQENYRPSQPLNNRKVIFYP